MSSDITKPRQRMWLPPTTNDQNHESVDKERANVPNACVAFVQIALTLNACAKRHRAILFTGKKNAVEEIVFTKLPHFPQEDKHGIVVFVPGMEVGKSGHEFIF